MNYLTDLTKEEIKYICKVIPYQETVAYFTKYPKEFSKLKPGFRVKSLKEEMITYTLYEYRTRNFIATYLIKHIDRWIEQIDEQLKKAKEGGMNQEAAYIDVLSQSYFVENIALYFKILEDEKSEEYLSILASAVLYEAEKQKRIENLLSFQNELKRKILDIQNQTDEQKRIETELRKQLSQSKNDLEKEKEKYRQMFEQLESEKIDLQKAKEDESRKTSEMQQKIDVLTQRVKEQTEYRSTISEKESKLTAMKEEIEACKNRLHSSEKQLLTYQTEKAELLTNREADKKRIKELERALDQTLSGENVPKKYSEGERNFPLRPEDMEDFDEYFKYNFENIGYDRSLDGSVDFLYYLEKIIFNGVPLLAKRGLGINLANVLSNTLYGVPVATRLLFSKDSDIGKVDEFLSGVPDRVVCIDGFIGNCNVMELIPILGKYRNKIIVLTYMFNKTLTFVPNEILSYVHFISADEFSALSKIKDITEDPSEIKEVDVAYKGVRNPDSRFQKIFRDIAMECGISASTATIMSATVEDENFLNEMLLFTLLPYVKHVLGKNPYNCSKRLQRYAGESGRSLKKEIIMRWFG